jgi:hypothetical protein
MISIFPLHDFLDKRIAANKEVTEARVPSG